MNTSEDKKSEGIFKFKYGMLLWGIITSIVYLVVSHQFFNMPLTPIHIAISICVFFLIGYFFVGAIFWRRHVKRNAPH